MASQGMEPAHWKTGPTPGAEARRSAKAGPRGWTLASVAGQLPVSPTPGIRLGRHGTRATSGDGGDEAITCSTPLRPLYDLRSMSAHA